MTIIEHFETEDEAQKRGCKLISSLSIPRPVYGLQVTDVVVVGPGRQGYSPQHGWTVQINTKLVPILRDPDGIPKEELEGAYQKVLEENAVLRRINAELRTACKMAANWRDPAVMLTEMGNKAMAALEEARL